MQAGYKFLVRMLCGLCLVGGFAACQKVDLPSVRGGGYGTTRANGR
ncbi:hypothetical protein [Paraprevotella clara]|nr:hypothetical protein [Paraprevotella clara]